MASSGLSERISALSQEDAREIILKKVEQEARDESARIIRYRAGRARGGRG